MKKGEKKVNFPPEIVPVSVINAVILARHEIDNAGFVTFLEVTALYIFFQLSLFCVASAIVELSSEGGKINKIKLFGYSIVSAVLIFGFVKYGFHV